MSRREGKSFDDLLEDKELLAKLKHVLRVSDEQIRRARGWQGARHRLSRSVHRDPKDQEFTDMLAWRLRGILSAEEDDDEELMIAAKALGIMLKMERWLLPLGEGNESDQFYTPPEYIEAARRVMDDKIDCDPASNDWANANLVKAPVYYTAKNTGLGKKPWHGNIWMNPPYSAPLISRFINKLLKEHRAGRCSQAVVLWQTTSRGSKAWKALDSIAKAKCYVNHKIEFIRPDGMTRESIRDQNIFFYVGKNVQEFRKEFKQWGDIVL